MDNTQIWLTIGAITWVATVWYAYSLGWWKGNTAAWREMRKATPELLRRAQ